MPRLDFYDADLKLFLEVRLSDSDVILGRGPDCSVRLPKKSVSRHHAIIRKRTDGYWIEDTSKHGTRVNAAMVTVPTRLEYGDRIYISEFRIVLRPDDVPPQEWSEEPTTRL